MSNAWTTHIDEQWIAWLRFDLQGEKVNKFTAQVMTQLDAALDPLATNQSIKAVVILSGKPDSFIVGADVNELASIRDSDDAIEKAQAGQKLFNKIAALDVPTVAVIHGPCMGGGLEMSLACDYRLATDHPKTSIALPEVNLGIIPGWGGTQRLPRLVGLPQALTMIMAGKPVNGGKAYRIGLVDALVNEAFLQEQAVRFIDTILKAKGKRKVLSRRKTVQPLAMRLLEKTPPGRNLIFKMSAKQALKRTKGHYPAPLEALEVIRQTYSMPIAEGLAIEAAVFGRLSPSSVSRNLVWIFQASQRAKKTHTAPPDSPPQSLQHTAVVGAGVMGGGIAWALSNKGLTVRLKDIGWDAITKGTATAAGMFRAMVKRRKTTQGQMNLAMHRISPTTEYCGFFGVDLVVEAIVEDMAIKQKVLKEIESQVRPDALICTNTSSLSITEMALALDHPERFVGLHFFNPVNRMPLVEVIPGEKTSPQTIVSAVALARQLGKTPVVVGNCAGFLVNRVLLPYVNESVRMFEEGVDMERIDRLIEQFGMPIGPLALADEVGLDVGLKVAQVLEKAFGSRMHTPELLSTAVKNGDMLGKKTGQGFYIHSRSKKKPNPDAIKLVEKTDNPTAVAISDSQIVDRAILTMVNEAARCLEEGIADHAETLDIAMLMGTGFAPFRGGLLRWADEVGPAEIAKRLDALAQTFGDRFTPAPLIGRLASDGGGFYQYQAADHRTDPGADR